MLLLEGKPVAEEIYRKLLLEISLLPVIPKLVVILVGENPASETYVKTKTKKCQSLGLLSETRKFSSDVTEEELLNTLQELNQDPTVHGILIQLPLPGHLNKARLIAELDPLKDVDGLTAENAGRLFQGLPRLVPCTPMGVMEIFKHYEIELKGKHAVVLGRSDIVGKPMAQLLLMADATVTICHSQTRNLEKITQEADLIVAAIGKMKWVKHSMVSKNAVVIDVGIHREEGSLCGDVDFDSVKNHCTAITPVPGGVGPMTIAILMKNLVQAASLQVKK